MTINDVIANCKRIAEGCDIAFYAEIANLLSELKERRQQDSLPKIDEKVFIIAPKHLKCVGYCHDLPSDAGGKWCKRWCRNGYVGYDVFETSVDRIEISASGVLLHTVADGYRSAENVFETEADARKELSEMCGGKYIERENF